MARSCTPSVPLPGFENFRRHWDPLHRSQMVKILPGQFYVTRQQETLETTLGSCVSACIRDASLGLGGMNHFMLPLNSRDLDAEDSHPWSIAARYGNYAMELLINAIIRNGGDRRNLEVKVFGGGKILAHMKQDIGRLNIDFIREYIKMEELHVLAEDLGGCHPRKVLYYPATGKARVKRLKPLVGATIARREAHYRSGLTSNDISGGVELFDEPVMD
jgi:chemotaxis protein CheD